ncbi:MAG TPA: hemerythrin domain-containing protein [Polyangia bacterium]|jgi:hemerythrin-like domain-containing protein
MTIEGAAARARIVNEVVPLDRARQTPYKQCMTPTRRQFVATGAALLVGASARAADKKDDDDEVSPTEDLMREHGILRRVLLIYGEALRRFDAQRELPAETLAHAATIVREFIEDYHEKDEEEFIFPRFEKAHRLSELVATLRAQHQAGRKLTADVLRLATAAGLKSEATRKPLGESLRKFIRMYEPHAAREDTVLFPAFRALVGERELKRLQDVFEDKEKALPHGGFEKMVDEVARLEQTLGIGDLATFTPT